MYRIEIKKSAIKELSQIPSPYNKKIIDAIDELALNPRPSWLQEIKRKRSLQD